MGSLLNSFDRTRLDLENPVGGSNRTDTITIFPATNTGVPTNTANPGKPISFFQRFVPNSTYLQNVASIASRSNLLSLGNTTKYTVFDATNFDLESSTVDGGIPYKADKDPTSYPATNSGTPTDKANPGAPSRFTHSFNPSGTYLSFIKTIPDRSNLIKRDILNSTNLDVEKPGVDGGIPYKTDKDPTSYPKTNTGTPTTSGPGAPTKFNQTFTPGKTYLDTGAKGKLVDTVANTNLDVENEKPSGGIPYKTDKDPTVFPKYVSGTPTTSANPGAPTKFNQTFNPKNVYLDKVPIKSNGRLQSTVANTDLDITTPSPNGFKSADTSTVYPSVITGTPTDKANPGAPSRFAQEFTPKVTYTQYIKDLTGKSNLLNLSTGNLDPITEKPITYSIFDATNLDIEKPGVDGGIPYKQEKDPTVYPISTQKKSSARGFYPIVGEEATKYNQTFSPIKTYTEFIKDFI